MLSASLRTLALKAASGSAGGNARGGVAFPLPLTSGSEATPQGGEQKEEGRGGRLVADATQVIDG